MQIKSLQQEGLGARTSEHEFHVKGNYNCISKYCGYVLFMQFAQHCCGKQFIITSKKSHANSVRY